jgi:chromosome segregation ATPase
MTDKQKKLRQVRDEERNSVADRIKANNDLKNVLNNQEKAMLGAADAQIAAANATLQQNKSIENQVALTNALANREGVLAQIEGLRSEQKANDLALNKELLDLTKSKQEAETQLAIDQKQFDAERLKDEEAILLAKKSALEFAQTQELERLQNVIKTTKEGTQARIDAENEYAAKKQEIENQITTTQDEIDTYRFNKKLEKEQLIIENDKLTFEAKLEALTEQERLITEATNISEEERTKLLKANADARTEIAQKEAEAKLKLLDVVSAGLSLASSELGESTTAGKVAAVAAASISTYTAIAGQLAAFSNVPVPGYAVAQAILTGATGLLQVKKILSVKTPKGGGGSAPSVGAAGGGGGAPQFNVVGNSGVNQLAETMQGRSAQAPIQAYVVAQNVTSAQSLNRNIVDNASLG